MPTRVFRRPDTFSTHHFYEARKIEADERGVKVWFAEQSPWPPPAWKQSIGATGTFEQECEATLARGYVEVDAARGQRLARLSEAEELAQLRRQGPFLAFPELQARLASVREPTATLEALLATLESIEGDLDEHDTPFPGDQRPPDRGALVAYQVHYRRLLVLARSKDPISAELLRYRYDPSQV